MNAPAPAHADSRASLSARLRFRTSLPPGRLENQSQSSADRINFFPFPTTDDGWRDIPGGSVTPEGNNSLPVWFGEGDTYIQGTYRTLYEGGAYNSGLGENPWATAFYTRTIQFPSDPPQSWDEYPLPGVIQEPSIEDAEFDSWGLSGETQVWEESKLFPIMRIS